MARSSKSLEVTKIAPNIQALHTLCDLPVGGTGVVRQLSGGREFTNVAARLGFTPGVEVTMVQNFHHGPLIVSLRDTRVALGRGEAVKILVEML